MLPANVWLYGRPEPLPERIALRAGPLSLLLERGELASFRLGEREVLRRVYVAVRDRNWGTVSPRFSDVRQEIGPDAFRISFLAEHREREIHFTWRALLEGDAGGTVRFAMDGEAHGTFLRNRIGFCVLHPDTSAGARCRIVHAGGEVEEAAFPVAIAPREPFHEIQAIAHEVAPGEWAELSFEGEIFETEDQRNWTDASFKTFCTPLRLPFPVRVEAGTRIAQAVTLRLPGAHRRAAAPAPRASSRSPAPVGLDLGAGAPVRLPAIGLGVASHGQPLGARELELLRALRPAHLRVDLELSRAGAESRLLQADEEASALGAGLEVALHLSAAGREELVRLASALRQVRSAVVRWLVFREGEAATSAPTVELAREVLGPRWPGVPLAAGTDAYFTELNRGPAPVFADEVVYSLNPQIHAFDVFSVVETLAVHGVTVENARRLSGGKPVVVSPVTLRPRFNAVATGPVAPPPEGELPEQVDVRQLSLFGAAFTLGSLGGLSAARAASVTCYETSGWRGVVETPSGSPLPERFPSLAGGAFPLYHVLADVAELAGGTARLAAPSERFTLAGLTLERGAGRRTLVGNLTPAPLEARLTGAPGAGRLRRLDLASVEAACGEPERFRAGPGELLLAPNGEVEVALGPYAVLCIDWEVA